MLFFAGTSHPALAQEVAKCLGIPLGKMDLSKFPDGETALRIQESVRGSDVFVLQSIVREPNNYLMELLIIVDALKRASAKSIIPVIPYYSYCRQDRKDKPREPITAKLVADLLTVAGASHVLAMDLHAGQVEGFFDIPVDHLHAVPFLAEAFSKEVKSDRIVVVAPDVGSIKKARAYARHLKVDLAVVDKRRVSATEVETLTLIGDVKGKDVLLADDMCTTGSTLVSAAKACREKGANRIFAAATHGLLVGEAVERLEQSPIELLFISNTIPPTERMARCRKIRTVSIAHLLAQAIRCITSQSSLEALPTASS